MVFFVTFLRAIAACLITNAHYTGIYPTDLIANGGLIGDILFFAMSGYCLYNVRLSFFRWYSKRIYRVYVPVVIITLIYMVLGFYSLQNQSWFEWFVYPTYYHFVASIILLYIPFYFAMRIQWIKERLTYLMIVVAVAWLVVYLAFCDKSFYHIDDVHNPMIRFLFFESMLLGAWFRQKDSQIRDNYKWYFLLGAIVSFVVYFASKMAFSKSILPPYWQFMNQIIIFVLLYFVMRVFVGIDSKLNAIPLFIKRAVEFLSDITLEIYVVQYVLIDLLRNMFSFPINWVVLTASIVVSAYLLHLLSKGFYALVDTIVKQFTKKKSS